MHGRILCILHEPYIIEQGFKFHLAEGSYIKLCVIVYCQCLLYYSFVDFQLISAGTWRMLLRSQLSYVNILNLTLKILNCFPIKRI